MFVDAGLSGKLSDDRPKVRAAHDAACQPAGVLVVYALSRLARSPRDTIAIADRLGRTGADLVSHSERLDTTTSSGTMLFRLLAVLAEFERALVGERTRLASAHKRARGERWGQVRQLRAAGWSLRRIACRQGKLATNDSMLSLASSRRARERAKLRASTRTEEMSAGQILPSRNSRTAPPAVPIKLAQNMPAR